MILEVLISCMNQEDISIVKQSGISTDALVINQCNMDAFQQWNNENQVIRMISTTERGLSRSRNMAIKHADGDICLFCDNDEVFYNNYMRTILEAFRRLPDADVILFNFDNLPHRFRSMEHRLNYLELLHAISCQIAFKKDSVRNAKVLFNPFMGAGSNNGAQEENKFLMDCYRKGLKIYYVPQTIGRIIENDSTWFEGYDEKFFYQRGSATRQLLGLPLSILYAFYYTVRKRAMYNQELSVWKALFSTVRGCVENPIAKQYTGNK